MGNFSFVKTEYLKNTVKEAFDKKTVLFILHALALAVGLILGAVTEPTKFIFRYYSENADNYYAVIMFRDSSAFTIFLTRILSNFGFFVLGYLIGFSVALFPVSMIVTAYRGYILSFTVALFGARYGFTGVMISVFLISPQNLITSVALTVCSVVSVLLKKKCKGKEFIINHGVFCGLGYVLSLVGAIIEILILGLLLRPLNFYF